MKLAIVLGYGGILLAAVVLVLKALTAIAPYVKTQDKRRRPIY